MQEMQSLNSRRFIVGQMWVVSAILLLTAIVFTVNAEQPPHVHSGPTTTHIIGDGLQVCVNFYIYVCVFQIICHLPISFSLQFTFYGSFGFCSIYYLVCPFDVRSHTRNQYKCVPSPWRERTGERHNKEHCAESHIEALNFRQMIMVRASQSQSQFASHYFSAIESQESVLYCRPIFQAHKHTHPAHRSLTNWW